MRLKKVMAAGMAAAMAFSLAACGSSNSSSSTSQSASSDDSAAESTQAASADTATASGSAEIADDVVYHVGICQQLEHQALDAATQGFEDALKEKLGDHVEFDLQNAQGEEANCATIVQGFVSNNYDLILANATGSLQAAAAATNTIPVLGTSVTDYATALDISDWTGATGTNISGTSDLAPIDQQAAMIQELVPDAKQVGIVYCSAEPNSSYQAQLMEASLDEMGLSYKEYTAADSNELQSVVTNATNDSDVIYIPTDNTVAANMEIVQNVAIQAGVPVITGEENMCKGGGVATLSIDYYELGKTTGEMAYEILVNGKNPGEMDVEFADATTKEYNVKNAEACSVTIPDDYVALDEE